MISSGSTDPGSSVKQAIAARDDRVIGPEQVVDTDQPVFSGTAAPGSVVKLMLSPATQPWVHMTAGTAHANSDGSWSLTTYFPLHDGQYRVLVSAFSRAALYATRNGDRTHPAAGPAGCRGLNLIARVRFHGSR